MFEIIVKETLDEMTLDIMPAAKLIVDKTFVNNTTADEMSVDKVSCCSLKSFWSFFTTQALFKGFFSREKKFKNVLSIFFFQKVKKKF